MPLALDDKLAQRLFAAAVDPLLIVDAAGAVLLANPAAQALFGYSAQAFAGLPVEALVPERYRAQHLHKRAAFAGDPGMHRISAGMALHGLRQDGSEFAAEITLSPIEDGLVLATIRDVSERRRTEEALRERTERYELVAAGTCDAIWDWDVPNHRVFFSPRWKELRGLAPEEVSDREEEWMAGIHPEDLPRVMAAVQDHFAGGTAVFAEEYQIRRKDGTWIWILDRGIARRDATGQVVRMAGSESDITARMAAVAALRESEAVLRQAQRLAGLGNWKWDLRSGAHTWSEEIYRIYGRDPALPPAVYPEVQQYFTPDSWVRLAIAVEQGLATGMPYECDAEVVRPDGSHRWILARGTAARDADGHIVDLHGTVQDITERKWAEEGLRESERRYRELVQNANSAIIRWSRDGAITFFNEYAQAFFGWRADEVVGRHVGILVPAQESTGADLSGLVQDIVDHPERYINNVNENVCRDGRRVWMTWTNHAIQDVHGRVSEILAVGSDITARRLAEEALRESKARLQLFIEHAPAALAMFDRDMHYLAISRRWMADFDLGERDILGRSHYEIFPEITEAWRAVHRRALAGEVVRAEEDRFERQDGSYQWLRWEVRPWHAGDGTVGGIVIFSEDITARKQAELSLQASEARFRATFEQAAMGIAHVAPDGRWLRVNNKLCEIVGYSRDELCLCTFQDITHPDDLAADLAHVRQLLAGERDAYQMEKRYLRKDGASVWAHLTVALVRHADGTPDYFIAVVEDIGARKRTEAALKALKSEMEQLTRFHIASQTVAALAHELNQPLNALASYAEAALRLLRAGNPQPERLRHAVESSAQQAQRAGRVVRELLAFMKKGEAPSEPLDLNQVVREVLARIEADGYGSFHVSLELEPSLALVQANRLQVEKVLVNLIENGIEAMRDAGVDTSHILVAVRTSAERGMAQVTVRDSGPGVDEQTLHRIFDPFFTTKPKGLGMGLAISRAIIEAHGGQLWVESEPGTGAVFHFTLPFAS